MQVIINEKMIKRNAKIGSYTSLAALVILGIGLYVSFVYPEFATWSFVALIAGFVLSQIGIYFGNRWGRHPRQDERLTAALKGLTKEYSLYHFMAPVNHLLVGPTGVFILEPYYQKGEIVYDKGKYKQKGGGLLHAYLKVFAQEGIGKPELEIKADLDQMKRFSEANGLSAEDFEKIKVVLAFSNKDANLVTNDSPHMMIATDALKTTMRNLEKTEKAAPDFISRIKAALPKESVV